MFGDVLTMAGRRPQTKFDGDPKTWSLRVGNRDTRWGLGWGSQASIGFGGVPDSAITTFPLEGGEVCVRAFFYDTRGGDAFVFLSPESNGPALTGSILLKSVTLKAQFTNKADHNETYYFRAFSPYCVAGPDLQTFGLVYILRFKNPDRFKDVFFNREGVVWAVSMTISSAKCDTVSARSSFSTNPSYWGNAGDQLPYATYQAIRRIVSTPAPSNALFNKNLGDLPNDLFKLAKPQSLDGFFHANPLLTALPKGLLALNFSHDEAVSLRSTFQDCGLIGLDADLFDSINLAVSLDSTFQGCGALKKLPQGFALPNIAPMSGNNCIVRNTFKGCGLDEVPESLFSRFNGAGKNLFIQNLFQISLVRKVPEGVFSPLESYDRVTLVGIFEWCQNLEYIPENLLNLKNLTHVGAMFKNCNRNLGAKIRFKTKILENASEFAPDDGNGWTLYAPRGSQTVTTLRRDVPRATVIEYDPVD